MRFEVFLVCYVGENYEYCVPGHDVCNLKIPLPPSSACNLSMEAAVSSEMFMVT